MRSVLGDSVPTDRNKKLTEEPVVDCIVHAVWFFIGRVACLCESLQVANRDARLVKASAKADLAFGEHVGPIFI